MKKILALMFMMCLLSSGMIAAQGAQTTTTNRLIVQVQSQVRGLEQARLNVRDDAQQARIEKIMEKMTDPQKAFLSQLEELTFEEDLTRTGLLCEGSGDARFLWVFKFQKQYKYEINEDGEISRQMRWWDRFIQEEIQEL